MANRPIADNEITGIWSFLLSIDWEERWLWGVIAFHICCGLLSAFSIFVKNMTLQASLFLSYLILVYSSEYVNSWAATNWRRFSRQQYFDSRGLFISIVFSTPLLINTIAIVLLWMRSTMTMLVRLKRAQHARSAKTTDDGKLDDGKRETTATKYESRKDK